LDPPGEIEINQVSSFGEDANHNLYIVDDLNGKIFRIVASLALGEANGNGSLALFALMPVAGVWALRRVGAKFS
jgi:hypothetical protein